MTHLRFEYHALNVQGLEILISRFQQKQLHLSSLDIAYISLPLKVVATLLMCLRSNETLEHLKLSHCIELSRPDLQHDDTYLGQSIRQFLQANTIIKSLDLSDNDLGSTIGIEVVKGLQSNTSLQSFKYDSNDLQNAGAIAVANALRTNRQLRLTLLDLVGNNIGDDGIIALSQSIQYQSHLTVLSLCCNHITARALIELGKALRYNMSIQRLYYVGMRDHRSTVPPDIQYVSAYKEFINAFQYNTTVQMLVINLDWEYFQDKYNVQGTIFEMLNNYNDTLISIGELRDAWYLLNNEVESILDANEGGTRTAPKKGCHIRSEMFHWLTKNPHL